MTNDFEDFEKDFPHNKTPQSAGFACSLGGFTGDEDFYLEYAESLTVGDIRLLVIKNYVEEKE